MKADKIGHEAQRKRMSNVPMVPVGMTEEKRPWVL
jgi:hypothetical protein